MHHRTVRHKKHDPVFCRPIPMFDFFPRSKKDPINRNKKDRHEYSDDRPKHHGEKPRRTNSRRLCPHKATDNEQSDTNAKTMKRTTHTIPSIPNPRLSARKYPPFSQILAILLTFSPRSLYCPHFTYPFYGTHARNRRR